MLGTGTPNPEADRMGPGVAVVSGDRAYIVDCGPGVVRRAAQAGIGIEQLTRAFIPARIGRADTCGTAISWSTRTNEMTRPLLIA